VAAGPAARTLSPNRNATDGATCATRREAGVTGFDCGAGAVPLKGDIPPARWFRPHLIDRSGVLALNICADPSRSYPKT
jgi:hypothetical protein